MTAEVELQKIGVKFFVEPPVSVELAEFIPVFHRWIQIRAVEGLLIDVADYSHVPSGPGILLIAHEANYAIEVGSDRMGLAYNRKQSLPGTLGERLVSIAAAALHACRELETAEELGGRIRFRGDEILVSANDRLLAPNTDEVFRSLEPHLSEFWRRLFGGAQYVVAREPDPKERFMVTAKASGRADIAELIERNGA